MISNIGFALSDTDSLAVGPELLVFRNKIRGPATYIYSILKNSWFKGMKMNTPRCLFGSASLGGIVIIVGGCDQHGNILSSAELYNSDTGKWEVLPDLNTPRRMCVGAFMDGKFYVLGGVEVEKTTQLTCGEEFNLETRIWRKIPDMCPLYIAIDEAPLYIAVVNNVLYAADFARHESKKYVKDKNSWLNIDKLPETVTSKTGWGMAFRACGDKLIFIGSSSLRRGNLIEVNAWIVDENAPRWNLLAKFQSPGNVVYNCAVMGC